MTKKTIGEFTLSVSVGGHPVWISISTDRGEIRFDHNDLQDLKHAVAEALRIAKASLPENYRADVE